MQEAFRLTDNDLPLADEGAISFFADRGGRRSIGGRRPVDTSGFATMVGLAVKWEPDSSLEEIRDAWEGWPDRAARRLREQRSRPGINWEQEVGLLISEAGCRMAEGDPEGALTLLEEARRRAESEGLEGQQYAVATLIYFQGVAALRIGENANCILCRGESSCILPISPAAVHQDPEGSRRAIAYFTEYLEKAPDDLGIRWLLNLAHMTLGEHPDAVDPRYLIPLDHFQNNEITIGKFVDVGERVGVNRFNQAGGSIMEDFDQDGLLDLAVTAFDPRTPMDLYRNKGDGKFERVTERSPDLEHQYGGLVCVQADYDNDGLVDIFIPRGAWMLTGIRPSLLKNMGDFRFEDVTAEAGLVEALNSNSANWGDFDCDGLVDLFICCEQQPHKLYRNLGNGKFEDVAAKAGLTSDGQRLGKGSCWIDYDKDGYPDLFINYINGDAQLYHNERNGRFKNVTKAMGIDGPRRGFTCWAFDFDNDGWEDIFATCYDQTVADVVLGMTGQPHRCMSNRLFRNVEGTRFEDVTKQVGLDLVFATMGANFADFNNDGYLDFYLGTGAPDLGMLVPNRMFLNVEGKRFVEVTSSAGVGHLQKGHAIACGDWDRDGDVDLFAQMGGAVDGDRFHNLLFQNPGQGNHWLGVKLVGAQSNRSAFGARIKATLEGEPPRSVCRTVSTGGSFGSNPLEQTIGLGSATKVTSLEIYWPTTGQKQVFRDLPADQLIEITEGSDEVRRIERAPIALPE